MIYVTNGVVVDVIEIYALTTIYATALLHEICEQFLATKSCIIHHIKFFEQLVVIFTIFDCFIFLNQIVLTRTLASIIFFLTGRFNEYF